LWGTFDYKVLHRSRPWLGIRWVTTTWYDENDLPLAGHIKDILPALGAQGWEVCGVGSGGNPCQFLAFMVILKRERTNSDP
jgi:hypothetical protein